MAVSNIYWPFCHIRHPVCSLCVHEYNNLVRVWSGGSIKFHKRNLHINETACIPEHGRNGLIAVDAGNARHV